MTNVAEPVKHTRAILAFTAALAVFLICLDAVIVSRERRIDYAEYNKQAQNELELIGTFVTEPLLRQKFAMVEEFILQWGEKKPHITKLRAFSPNGLMLAEFIRSTPESDTITVRHSVQFLDQHLLDLELVKDLSPILSHLQEFWKNLILQSLLISVVLGIILWFILRNMALKPLEAEIGRRKRAEEGLQKTHDQLEIRVAERTAELTTAIEDLHREMIERDQAEDALAKSKEEWALTFNAMSDIVTVQDKNMRIVRANKAAHQVFQVKPGGLNGKYCYQVFHGVAEPCSGCPLLDTIQDTGNHSAIINYEKLGRIFQISSAAIPAENGDIKYLVHIARDITEQKQLEEKLFHAQKMEAIGTLAGGIAHDFNNILSVITGYSELAKLDIQSGGRPEKMLDQVTTAATRATELVKQILTFSRKTEHHLQPLMPQLIVKEALKMLRSSLPTTISIEEDIDIECGLIMADPTHVHQIVMNLCTNAYHAMENEKGTLSVNLCRKEIRAEDISESGVSPGHFIVLSVSDTGHGIYEQIIDRIFDPYFTTKEVGRGTGLGLAVIHGIVKDYKGFVQVESKPGKGSSFHVHIPALKDDILTLEETEDDKPLPTGNERILIVDDESAIVNMNKSVLEPLGYTVTGTTNSEEAFEKIRSNPEQFDLIIADQTMPNLTGSELAEKVLKIKPAMPIILYSGHSSVITEKGALAIGIKKYASKPVTRKELARIVRTVLDEN